MAEQRYQAVLAVISEGATIIETAARFGVSRNTMHAWPRVQRLSRDCSESTLRAMAVTSFEQLNQVNDDRLKIMSAEASAHENFLKRSILSEAYIGQQIGLHAAESVTEVEKHLLSGMPINGLSQIPYGDGLFHLETPLYSAIVDGRLHIAEALLAKGANPDIGGIVVFPNRDRYIYAPIHQAVNKGLSNFVSVLLEYGADVDAITGMGTTALHLAASQNDLEIFQLLHRRGADFTALEFSLNAGAMVEVSVADKAQSSVSEYMRAHGLLASAK